MGAVLALAAPASTTGPDCAGRALFVTADRVGLLDPGTGALSDLGPTGTRINALGFVPAHEAGGAGRPAGGDAVPEGGTENGGGSRAAHAVGVGGGQLVRVDPSGAVTRLGPVPGADLATVYAGASAGPLLYLLGAGTLTVVDTGRRALVSRRPVDIPYLGDWELVSGRLYGVSAEGVGPARLVAVDPGTGRATVRALPERVPAGGNYGAAFAVGRVLHVLDNVSGALVRVPLDDPDLVVVVPTGVRAASVDAAYCPAPPAPVPTPAASPVPPPASRPAPAAGPPTVDPTPPAPPEEPRFEEPVLLPTPTAERPVDDGAAIWWGMAAVLVVMVVASVGAVLRAG
ncbi:hypothetical protein AB0M43_28120 [Longispora sp. NPDC051575]|uniref:DUF6923 family protein n=1 Tax=Longispora sp. NPDC051575 TaxID=3154943 RepID=UPI003436A0EC